GGRLDVVWTRSLRQFPALSFLCRPHLEGSQTSRSSRSAANEVRTGHQSQDREGAWPRNTRQAAGIGRRGDRVKRRTFITLLGGPAVAWPLAARAQQSGAMRRIGVLLSTHEGDPGRRAQLAAFVQRLTELGWTDGRNARLDVRWTAGSVDVGRQHAMELVALAPDVITT